MAEILGLFWLCCYQPGATSNLKVWIFIIIFGILNSWCAQFYRDHQVEGLINNYRFQWSKRLSKKQNLNDKHSLCYSDNTDMEVSLQGQRPLSYKDVFNHTNVRFKIKPFLGSFPFARTTLVNSLCFFFPFWLLGFQYSCSCSSLILSKKVWFFRCFLIERFVGFLFLIEMKSATHYLSFASVFSSSDYQWHVLFSFFISYKNHVFPLFSAEYFIFILEFSVKISFLLHRKTCSGSIMSVCRITLSI